MAGDVPYYIQEGNAMKTKTNIKAGTTAVSKPGAFEVKDYGFGVSMPVTTS